MAKSKIDNKSSTLRVKKTKTTVFLLSASVLAVTVHLLKALQRPAEEPTVLSKTALRI